MRTSDARRTWLGSAKLAASALALVAMGLPAATRGQPVPGCEAPDDCLPPRGIPFAAEFQRYPGSLTILGPVYDSFGGCHAPPGRGESVFHRMSCRFRGTLISPEGVPEPVASGDVAVAIRVSWHGRESGGVRVFDTEILSMDFTTASGPYSLMIRESPTIASTGQTRIDRVPGGGYSIQSFFDLFTEASLDGGQSWTPSRGPTRIVACAAP